MTTLADQTDTIFDFNLEVLPNPAVVLITPEAATDWLHRHNTHNRTLRPATVERYARDMTTGAWAYNGDPIRFATDGTLLDGQHRLAAIAQSGVTICCVIVKDLDAATQATMDIGAIRTLGDTLTLGGVRNGNACAAILRQVLCYQHPKGFRHAPTHAEMRAHLGEHPDIEAATRATQHHRGLQVRTAVLGAGYVLCARADRADAAVFFTRRLINSEGLTAGDPVLALRRRFERTRDQHRRVPAGEDLCFIVTAWNLHRAARQVRVLRAPRDGFTAGAYPMPR